MFKYLPYSFSKMDLFRQCPNKFFLREIQKIEIEIKNKFHIEKGSLFHGILQAKLEDELRKYKMEDYRDLTKQDVSNIIQSVIMFCKSDVFRKIISRQGIELIEQKIYLDFELNPTEDKNKTLLKGYIDYGVVQEDKKRAFVYDWKTGGKSAEMLSRYPKDSLQLMIYALWVIQKYDLAFVISSYVFVEHMFKQAHALHKIEVEGLKSRIFELIEKIETEEKFERNKTRLCDWCEYQEICEKDQ